MRDARRLVAARATQVQRMDASMQLLRGLPWSVGSNARAGMAESAGAPPFS